MGEFEKRIMLIMGKGTLIPPKTPTELRDRINDVLGDFQEIVEEAKKEFPNLEEASWNKLHAGKFPKSDENILGMFNSFLDVKKWFEKWFGKADADTEKQ